MTQNRRLTEGPQSALSSVRLPPLSAVIFELGVDRFELPAEDAMRLRRYLRVYEDPSGSAQDLADRIERAAPHGHTVYPARAELVFVARALRDLEGSLSDAGTELLRAVRREMGY